MRGPLDDAIDTVQVPAEQPAEEARGAPAAERRPAKRPPGGKALVRLMQLLESRDLEATAAELGALLGPQSEA